MGTKKNKIKQLNERYRCRETRQPNKCVVCDFGLLLWSVSRFIWSFFLCLFDSYYFPLLVFGFSLVYCSRQCQVLHTQHTSLAMHLHKHIALLRSSTECNNLLIKQIEKKEKKRRYRRVKNHSVFSYRERNSHWEHQKLTEKDKIDR